MNCPKCGGEIPFYNLKPNCMHCGVNIMYYTQHAGLTKDAKRTELESAAARMVIARIKASFIGSKLAIARLVVTLLAVAVFLVPFAGVRYSFTALKVETLSVGLIGLITGFMNGTVMMVPDLLKSALAAGPTKAILLPTGVMLVLALLALTIVAAYLVSFLRLTQTTRFMKNAAFVGVVIGVVGQIAILIMYYTSKSTPNAQLTLGFGSLAAAAVFAVLWFLNNKMLKKGIEPTYRENDPKRRELLKKVRAGEVDLDSLPLPVFESEEEREERLKALEEALKAEEEGKEL